ncbi:MAG: hypothetical protein HZB26_23050 [Candidatus Hydrogenedentes bacterium]|nr:hypothetical protein [Candidatus Hydrogenedentota bacterium]
MISSQTAPTDEPRTFEIHLTDNTIVYGYIRKEEDHVYYVEFDSGPNKGDTKPIPAAKVVGTPVEESKGRREARLQEQEEQEKQRLKARGLTTFAGRQIPEEEVARAQDAKRMALAREESRKTPSGPAAPAQVEGATVRVDAPSAEAPGFFQQWGRHILIGVAGLALAAVIIKTLLL